MAGFIYGSLKSGAPWLLDAAQDKISLTHGCLSLGTEGLHEISVACILDINHYCRVRIYEFGCDELVKKILLLHKQATSALHFDSLHENLGCLDFKKTRWLMLRTLFTGMAWKFTYDLELSKSAYQWYHREVEGLLFSFMYSLIYLPLRNFCYRPIVRDHCNLYSSPCFVRGAICLLILVELRSVSGLYEYPLKLTYVLQACSRWGPAAQLQTIRETIGIYFIDVRRGTMLIVGRINMILVD